MAAAAAAAGSAGATTADRGRSLQQKSVRMSVVGDEDGSGDEGGGESKKKKGSSASKRVRSGKAASQLEEKKAKGFGQWLSAALFGWLHATMKVGTRSAVAATPCTHA